MKTIIQSTHKQPERYANAIKIQQQLSGAKIYVNDLVNNYHGFIEIMNIAKHDDLLFIEDDALLCDNFENLAFGFINKNPCQVIQFMDLKKSDIKTCEMPGSSFCMSVCVFIPMSIILEILNESENYLRDNPKHPKAHDYLIGYCLKLRKEKYIMHRPCLAQHLSFRSVAHPGASMGRQTKYFIDDIK